MCNGNCECGCSDFKLTMDEVNVSSRQMTDEGFLRAKVVLARAGIQQYRAGEINDASRDPNEIVLVYRPPEEVFSKESMSSFEGKPVTLEHPPELINTDNINKYQIGFITKKVNRDGDFITSELTITDKDAINNVQSGKVEVSNGYVADYDFTPGVTEKGEKYDAIQKNIRGNHVAIVQMGRCGSDCRILDSQTSEDSMQNEKEQMMKKDEESTGSSEGSELWSKIEELKNMIIEKDKEIYALKEQMSAQTDEYNSLKMSEDECKEKTLDEKIEVIDTAKSLIANYDYKGKTLLQIKKDVIANKHSNATFDNKSDEYINARFDIIKEDLNKKGSEQMATAVADSIDTVNKKLSAREEMILRNINRGK